MIIVKNYIYKTSYYFSGAILNQPNSGPVFILLCGFIARSRLFVFVFVVVVVVITTSRVNILFRRRAKKETFCLHESKRKQCAYSVMLD